VVGDIFEGLRVKHMEDDAIMMRNILKMSGAAPTSPAAIQQGKLRSPGLRVLTGRVGKVKEWASQPLTSPVLFKVHGILDTEIGGAAELSSKSKQFELTGEDGQHLSCTFLETDREVPIVRKGERVVVMGRVNEDGSLQVVSIEEEVGVDSNCLAKLENFAVRGIRLAMRQKQDEAAAAL